MRVLLDEMFAGLKEYFEALGYNVLTAQEAGLGGAKDREVVEYAFKHDLILVTQDQKPAELADLLGAMCVLVSGAMIARVADARIHELFGSP